MGKVQLVTGGQATQLSGVDPQSFGLYAQFSAAGDDLLVRPGTGAAVWHLYDEHWSQIWQDHDDVTAAFLTPDGHSILTNEEHGWVVHDLPGGETVANLETSGAFDGAAAGDDAATIAVISRGGSDKGRLHVYRRPSGQPTAADEQVPDLDLSSAAFMALAGTAPVRVFVRPDARELALVTDNNVALVDLDPAVWMSTLCDAVSVAATSASVDGAVVGEQGEYDGCSP